jgi:diphthine synthase
MVEQKAEDTILKDAKEKNTCFLVVGDPFSATTHMDIWQRAKEAGITTTITHNASILNTAGEVGLELYKFGKVTSIPFKYEAVRTPYEVYQRNKKEDMHTLFLLDIDVKEEKFMTCKEAITYLLEQGLEPKQTVICCAQLGGKDPRILTCPAKEVEEWDIYPQCLIIPGKLHFMEEEMIQRWI